MTRTSLDVASQALRRIGVLAVGDTPTADDKETAVIAMQGALDELTGSHGVTVAWTIETVPDNVFMAFSDLIAAEVASVYSLQGPNRSRALTRMKAVLLPDDREDYRDTDDDGTVSTEEADAGERAAYY